MSKTERT